MIKACIMTLTFKWNELKNKANRTKRPFHAVGCGALLPGE